MVTKFSHLTVVFYERLRLVRALTQLEKWHLLKGLICLDKSHLVKIHTYCRHGSLYGAWSVPGFITGYLERTSRYFMGTRSVLGIL